MRKALIAVLLAVVGMFLSTQGAQACHPWLNVNNYLTETRTPIRFFIAYGHNYPFGHSFYDNERIEELYFINPKDQEAKAEQRVLGKDKYSQVQFESTEDLTEGTYLVVMEGKGNFGAFTSKGYKRQPKKELKGETIKGKVTYSQSFCKAVVNIGGKSGGDSYSRVLGHGLEIVPLKDPGDLRTNDILPLRVLHNGKPLDESVMVYATYMGFSNKTDVFAYTAWASSYNKGVAEIRLLQPGTWMVFTNHKLPYPDGELADQYNYQATLTFEVKP
ncbi:MAG: Nickel uptake substrate-specific transmembrane region [Syntrophorhabdaceae bacterium PtaU1.Bin034]|nr:MAG: Nickel uptake substrate-specific transmembrane region [Syntrophorhabdaceae bacterium PtaU1.Bin034]